MGSVAFLAIIIFYRSSNSLLPSPLLLTPPCTLFGQISLFQILSVYLFEEFGKYKKKLCIPSNSEGGCSSGVLLYTQYSGGQGRPLSLKKLDRLCVVSLSLYSLLSSTEKQSNDEN